MLPTYVCLAEKLLSESIGARDFADLGRAAIFDALFGGTAGHSHITPERTKEGIDVNTLFSSNAHRNLWFGA